MEKGAVATFLFVLFTVEEVVAYAAERPAVVQCPDDGFVFGQKVQWNKTLVDPVQVENVVVQFVQRTVQVGASQEGHEEFFPVGILVPTEVLQFVFCLVEHPVVGFIERVAGDESLQGYDIGVVAFLVFYEHTAVDAQHFLAEVDAVGCPCGASVGVRCADGEDFRWIVCHTLLVLIPVPLFFL